MIDVPRLHEIRRQTRDMEVVICHMARFPPVERSDHGKRPLNGAPGQPDPVAVEPLKRPVVVLHHHEQVIDVDLRIVFVDHPVPEIRIGGVLRLQEVGRLELVLGRLTR